MFTQQEITRILQSMEVYDSNGKSLGVVDICCDGEGSHKTSKTDTDTIITTISNILGRHKEMPTIMYLRLYEEGFIRIRRGLFQRDLIVESDQIQDANEISLHLNVPEDELIQI